MAKPIQSYHWIWLQHHPERNIVWLLDKLSDGFHIHHIDGNHANDDPLNLVLIEEVDHLRLHNGSLKLQRIRRPKMEKKPYIKKVRRAKQPSKFEAEIRAALAAFD